MEPELHACQVELITDVCRSAAEAVATLAGLRRAVLATGAGLLGSGTHPSALEGEAEITDKARYERIRELLGDAVATPVGGLHIHVGMPDAETAIRAFNGLRRHLPLLQALAANSPFRHGRDTGLASAREVTHARLAALGRAARDARLRGLRAVERAARPRRRRAGLHLVLVEAAPAPATRDRRGPRARRAGLARGHRRARRAHALPGAPRRRGRRACPTRRPRSSRRASFRAARFGVEAGFPTPTATCGRSRELLDEALEAARAARARTRLRATSSTGFPALLARGGGAGRQRALYAIGGMDALLRELTELTGASAAATAEYRYLGKP